MAVRETWRQRLASQMSFILRNVKILLFETGAPRLVNEARLDIENAVTTHAVRSRFAEVSRLLMSCARETNESRVRTAVIRFWTFSRYRASSGDSPRLPRRFPTILPPTKIG
uniref:Uncharacterized protein n=1 Tax=Branchiostoma floridae TaxID=7739 RepID=C3Z1B3_BRAFL|eukprot:XP_002597642.1 hypothetical protein BRAFLDRAFT_77442 [Branchiostoma floridae]